MDRVRPAYLALVIVAAACWAYRDVPTLGFLRYDDPAFVVDQPATLGGLDLRAALTTVISGNWVPVAVLSHQLDVAVFGLDPAGHHVSSLFIHVIASVLWLFALRRTTSTATATLVALTFALHPLHVESVAWISERRDVLSGLFTVLTVGAWLRPRWRETVAGRIVVTALAALAMMSKSSAVTLPAMLLLLDVWPLRRWPQLRVRRLLLEKLPMFAVSAATSAVTLVFQQPAPLSESTTLAFRLAGTVVGYAHYLGAFFVPRGLAVLVPRPQAWPALQVAIGAAALLAVLALVVACRRSAPSVSVGLLWFLGVLVPMIGLVQVGQQAYADRYTYVAYVGLALAAAGGGQLVVEQLLVIAPRARQAIPVCAIMLVGAWLFWLGHRTSAQVPVWRDTRALFTDAIRQGHASAVAHDAVANDLAAVGEWQAALPQFQAAVQLEPSAKRHADLGFAYLQLRQATSALASFEAALALDATDARAHHGIALALLAVAGAAPAGANPDLRAAAAEHLRIATRLDPGASGAQVDLARALLTSGAGDVERADAHAAVRRAVVEPRARTIDLFRAGGLALVHLDDPTTAQAAWDAAARKTPGAVEVRMALAWLGCAEPRSLDAGAAARNVEVLRELLGPSAFAGDSVAVRLAACAGQVPEGDGTAGQAAPDAIALRDEILRRGGL